METIQEFHQLLDDEWEARMQFDPIYATLSGDNRYNDRLPHVTPADYQRRLANNRGYLARLEKLDRASLPAFEQLNYDIFHRELHDAIDEDRFGAYYLPLSKAGGFHLEFPELFAFVPLQTITDYENYIARLAGFHQMVMEYIELMLAGLAENFRPARQSITGLDASLGSQVVTDPTMSPLYQPFTDFPAGFSTAEQQRLRQEGSAAILSSVAPGYAALIRFIQEEYLPGSRQSVGATDLPGGREFYAHRIRLFTSLNLSAEEVHATGQEEVNRIRAEMLAAIDKTGFKGSFHEFIDFLRSDPRFYATTGEELLMRTALVLKRMDGELPRLFKTLPRMPYGIRAIPEHSAPGNTTAYYFPAAGDGSRAGYYYVNLFDLPSRPFYEIEALSLHEAVPGHHLQIALQQELGELPKFRRFGGFTAFVEGWALYSERLGLEVGFYQDPYSDFGRLSYEMWRACRLVVDTGMHALGWSRQQAIDFMAENTSSTLLNITNEVDRYIAWPGQALAYKIGELKIRALRARAEEQLGERFDLREFHDLLLGSGALPLDILESMVNNWVAAQIQN
jgi:uncharacterized protein (DUF885 family)